MTNDEKLTWLNFMNAHLAAGGKLECIWNCEWVKAGPKVPDWNSNPECWRIVPLPRRAVIRVAYCWDASGRFYGKYVGHDSPIGGEWKIKEIEVSDE